MQWLTDLPIYLQVFLASAVGVAFVNFVFKVGELLIQDRIDHSKESYRSKKRLADVIIEICAEGQEKKYRQTPESDRKIHIVINQLESMDSNVLIYFLQFYNDWITTYTIAQRAESKEAQEFTKDMAKETEKSRKALLKALNVWKK